MLKKKIYDPVPASNALLEARRNCFPLNDFPGDLPMSLGDAYSIQFRSISLWDDQVIGFKVGGIPAPHRKAYGGTWLAGPIFSKQVYRVGQDGETNVSVFEGGFAAYEAEYVFRLNDLDSLKDPVEHVHDAKSFVNSVYIGAEIASSPMALINEIGPGAIISDFGNNAGMVIGPEVPLATLDSLSDFSVTVTIDGARIGRSPANPGENGPLGALKFFLNHILANRQFYNFPDTLWLSSGAITGVHSSKTGSKAGLSFGSLGQFKLHMVPRRPI